jgi:hypothetical protein
MGLEEQYQTGTNDQGLLPPGWVEHIDPKTNKPYYHHIDSMVVQWGRPGRPFLKSAEGFFGPGISEMPQKQSVVMQMGNYELKMVGAHRPENYWSDIIMGRRYLTIEKEWKPNPETLQTQSSAEEQA